ncbi:MAG: hypothetical protein M3R27_08850 [Bacteroidota bacterium]|nr:hypothetical protein [Bacteroidota bacterium]
MLVRTKIFLLFFFTILFFTSCHKEGIGGKGTIKGVVKHHDNAIPNSTVYIKFGATEFPGTNVSAYDANVSADASGNYEIKDLYRGDYYLYGIGMDAGDVVTGGVAVKLKRNKTVTIDVPVTE